MKISFVTPKYNISDKMPISIPNMAPSCDIRFKGGLFENDHNCYHHNVSLPQKVNRPGTRESTLKKFDNVYAKYKSSLCEISKEEIEATINNLHKKTGYSKEQIVRTMQDITQFGNIGSVTKIAKDLEEYDISSIGVKHSITDFNNDDTSNFGINNTLNYLIRQKKIGKLLKHSGQNAIFLDDNKLTQYENLKERDPAKLEEIVNNKNNHFFILSGFNEGVNFLNISSEILEAKTKNALALKDIDQVSKSRAKALGIEPIVLENKKEDIYEQLKPLQISKKEMLAVIDANLMVTQDNPQARIDLKDDVLQYLDNSLDVYTPAKLSKDLKEIHANIKNTVLTQNKTMDDVVYVIPFPEKSYDYINYQYQLVNNIPAEKFVEIPNRGVLPKENDKIYVLLDDSTISGNSMRTALPVIYDCLQMHRDNNSKLIIAPLYSSDFAEQDMEFLLDFCNRTRKDVMLKQNSHQTHWACGVKNEYALLKSLGEPFFDGEFRGEYPCVIFPYMAPDNNSKFSSNIALFHSPLYRDNPMSLEKDLRASIKSYGDDAENVARLAEELLSKD